MTKLASLKARYPKLFSAAVLVGALGGIGGIAAYERYGSGECCAPGASCCHPGAACCNQHKHAQETAAK